MHALNAQGVVRFYGSRKVLDGFSLTLEPGSFEVLMGPSGSGKSTFLHLAAGLLSAEEGSIEVGEKDLTRLSDSAAAKFRRTHIGVVFQAFNLLNEKTVAQNIILPLTLAGVRERAALKRANFMSLVSRLGLNELINKHPAELSGGEQQRVAFARALIAEPDLLLADEPTGNLDTQAAKEVCGILRELNRDSKTAILVVTHDPQVAACAEKVHFLKEGKIAASYATEGSAARVSQLYLETYA